MFPRLAAEMMMSDCGCEADTLRAGRDPAYRRKSWIVMLPNRGLGRRELVGGFAVDSQASRPHSLGFVGDARRKLAGHMKRTQA